MKKLNFEELESLLGGVSREEYCRILGTIMANNDLKGGAKEGAQYGWNKYCS